MKTITATLALVFSGLAAFGASFNTTTKTAVTDGTRDDVQAAINNSAVTTGWTVLIPNGSYSWSSSVSCSKAIHLRGESKGGVRILNGISSGSVLKMTKSTAGYARVSNLIFMPGPSSSSPSQTFHLNVGGAWSAQPVLVDNNDFYAGDGFNIYSVLWDCNGGVIWNNRFYSTYKTVNGISLVMANDTSWTNNSTMGLGGDPNGMLNTYIEDNIFDSGFNACINADDNSRVVVRYNVMTNATISPHGADTSWQGVRHQEVYGNNFVYNGALDSKAALNYWFYWRGGTGVICSNIMPDIPWGKVEVQLVCQNIRRSGGPYACWTSYPVPRQVGQSWADGRYVTDPIYVWGNIGPAQVNTPTLTEYNPDECGNGQSVVNYIQNGRDYVMGPKPGWRPYTYPHPLRNAAAKPGVPTNLRVVTP